MRILAYNPGHDGAAALLEDGRLTFSIENEKDNGHRYSGLTPTLFLRSLQLAGVPDAVAVSGWDYSTIGKTATDDASASLDRVEAGYSDEGPRGKIDGYMEFAGRNIRRFSSSHVRSHVMGTYGLSPFPQGQPCYALIWEGTLGSMYYVDGQVGIAKIGDILPGPGNKYVLLYALADPRVLATERNWLRLEDAGKLMALAAYGRRGPRTREQQDLIDAIMAWDVDRNWYSGQTPKRAMSNSRYCDIGVENQDFKDLARQFSEAMFDHFYQFAKAHVKDKLPLLIAGGCGLNCDWNSQWKNCGLFSDVFVPPCANDSGIALGAAVDAQHHYTGSAKVDWSVYAGEAFVEDVTASPDFESTPLNLSEVCRCLLRGDVIAWVQGRYEIGPRALGNRSLLATPFCASSRDKLNRIKQREPFRPVAPICLEEDFGLHFENHGPSPHMLYFQRVKSKNLAAITHVDGSARAQSVNESDNPQMCALLREFRELSGAAVLCNTSLNFSGRGFINRLSHLFVYARQRGLDGLVAGTRFWKPRHQSANRESSTQNGATPDDARVAC